VKVSDGPQPELEYAQLLLLFEAWMPTNEDGSKCMWQPFAYVRWYDKQQNTRYDPLAAHGAVPFAWDMGGKDPVTKQAAQRCSVIHLNSIARREYIAEEVDEGASSPSGRFYVNPFKY
jgi:hypothetical protein